MRACGFLSLLLVATIFAALCSGAVHIAPLECLQILFRRNGADQQNSAVLLSIRLPRIVLGCLTGAGLGISGAAIQGLFRNPLADPSLIGISGGAMLATTSVFVLGDLLSAHWLGLLPAAAFAGALVTTILVHRLSYARGQTVIATMLLAGIALNAFAQAGASLMTYFATDAQIRSITFWRLGSLGGATWNSILLIAPFVVIPVLALPFFAGALNAFLFGESTAFHLGIPVERSKNLIIVLVAMAAGASVAFTGIIAFAGLIVPHLVRLMTGPDYRTLLPASALLGAAVLVGSDIVARTIVAPAELPIGIILALAGAPFFLWLLLRDRPYA